MLTKGLIKKLIREELAKLYDNSPSLSRGTTSLSELLTEATVDQIKSKFVGTGTVSFKLKSKGTVEAPQLSESDWKKLSSAKMHLGKTQIPLKPVYLEFLIKNILAKVITLKSALEKFADKGTTPGYISNHSNPQYKNKFSNVDINNYKDAKEFEKDASDIMKVISSTSNVSSGDKNLVSTANILKLKNVGIKYLGMVAGYQAFKIPKGISMNAYGPYSEILGDCAGRDKGGIISLCTVQDKSYFEEYTSSDDLYVFFNKKDPVSPYQFHYKEAQFMDKNDKSVI